MTDIINIFEKVQMIGINVQNNADFWGDSERMFSKKDLYPENDPIELICSEIKKELF